MFKEWIMSENDKYPRGIEVVSGPFVINDKKQVLLCLSPKWNCWVVPGGHVEPGEKAADAAVRETKEELGLDIEILDLLNVAEAFVSPPKFKRNAHFVFFNYIARLKSEAPVFSDEISEMRWFDISEAAYSKKQNISCQEECKLLFNWVEQHPLLK